MSQYKDMFMDTVIEQMSDTIVEKSGENITQQLYEQMKRNYNIS
jgi:flagellar protein FlgJ